MTERSWTMLVTVAGAVVGAAAGYLFFTDHGRHLRRQFEPMLDDVARELNHFRGTVQKAGDMASEGWRLFNAAFGETDAYTSRYSSPHQSSPF